MRLFRAFLVSLATASIDLPRDWQAQHCRGTHLEATGETVVALATDAARGFLPIIGVVNSTVHNSKSDVGFVIVTFQSEGEADFKDCPLDKNQRNCIEFSLNARPMKLYIPKDPLQYKLWAFATSPLCENTVFLGIILNTVSLAMKVQIFSLLK